VDDGVASLDDVLVLGFGRHCVWFCGFVGLKEVVIFVSRMMRSGRRSRTNGDESGVICMFSTSTAHVIH
jgi:hypothetical protein